MSQMQPINYTNNIPNGTPLHNYGGQSQTFQTQPQQQTVTVATPNSSQIYQYPQTSVYNDPTKKAASGVNIYIYNPSAIGGPNTNYSTPVVQPVAQPSGAEPMAATNINEDSNKPEETKKTKRITELTDDYIKLLENWLKDENKETRNIAIRELVKRFEEDETRYEDPALTALLNIALQDPSPNNRIVAMSPIAAGTAHGDKTTIELLTQRQHSEAVHGQEAAIAGRALIKAQETTQVVPDNSPDKPTIIYKYQ